MNGKLIGGCLTALLVASSAYGADPLANASKTTLESNYTCLRVELPVANFRGTDTAPAPGNKIARSNDEWRKMWTHLRNDEGNAEPPMPLPEGFVAVAMSVFGSMQSHIHIRRIDDKSDPVVFESQLEFREFPARLDGSRISVGDDADMESLVVFFPLSADKKISFKQDHNLDWTPETETDAVAKPPCQVY